MTFLNDARANTSNKALFFVHPPFHVDLTSLG